MQERHEETQGSSLDNQLQGSLFDGFRALFTSSYLMNQALFILLMTWIATIGYFLQTDLVARSFSDIAARTQALADIDLVVNICSAAVLIVWTEPLHWSVWGYLKSCAESDPHGDFVCPHGALANAFDAAIDASPQARDAVRDSPAQPGNLFYVGRAGEPLQGQERDRYCRVSSGRSLGRLGSGGLTHVGIWHERRIGPRAGGIRHMGGQRLGPGTAITAWQKAQAPIST